MSEDGPSPLPGSSVRSTIATLPVEGDSVRGLSASPEPKSSCRTFRRNVATSVATWWGPPDLPPMVAGTRTEGRCQMLSRRHFIQAAAAMGASLAFAHPARASRTKWSERRDLFPHGVASGDPDQGSVILWTRRPYEAGDRHLLTVEVAEDEAFRRVIAQAPAPVSAASGWTRARLVGGVKPA